MSFEFGHLTDLELVLLQDEARKSNDIEFLNAVLIELGKRQESLYVQCPDCKGTGTCARCNGSGEIVI